MVTDIEKIIDSEDDDLFTVVGTSEENIEKLDSAPYSYWRSVWKNLFKNKVAIFCLVLIAIVIFFTIFGPMMLYNPSPKNPIEIARLKNLSPNSKYWFGTSGRGECIWTIIWEGSRFSLLLAAISSVINIIVGLVVGGLWGYIRKLDPILIEFTNVINNIPSLLIYLMLMQLLEPSFWSMVFVMCLFGWLGLASMMRNQIIIIRNREFNIASETLGSSSRAIIIHNLLPNLVSIIVQVVSGFVPSCISMEVSLQYFNLMDSSQITLGKVLNNAAEGQYVNYPHTLFFPAIVLMIITIAFFYFGLALADATDPKTHM